MTTRAQALLQEIAVEAGPGRKVTFGRLFSGGFALLGRSPWAVWALAAAWFAAAYAANAVPRALGYGPEVDAHGPAYWVQSGALDLVEGLLGGQLLRLWLDPAPRWRLDRRLAVYVAISTLGSLAETAMDRLSDRLLGVDGAGTEGVAGMIVSLVQVGAQLAWLWPVVMLMLWPMSYVAGDTPLAPTRAWSLMWRAVLPFIFATLAFGIPTAVAIVFPAIRWSGFTLSDVCGAAAVTVVDVYSLAVAAVVYQVRVRGVGDVAAVFD